MQRRQQNVNHWGRSRLSLTGPGSQLARVEVAEPTDFAVYLYGWRDMGSEAVSAGAYEISAGSGGVSVPYTYNAAARGTVLHFCASVVQVNSLNNSGALGVQHVDRVTIGKGRPQLWSLHTGTTAPGGAAQGPAIALPPWTTRAFVMGVYDSTAEPRAPIAGAQVVVYQASDPTFVGGDTYAVATLPSGGEVPLAIDSGYLKFITNGPPGIALVRFEGIQ